MWSAVSNAPNDKRRFGGRNSQDALFLLLRQSSLDFSKDFFFLLLFFFHFFSPPSPGAQRRTRQGGCVRDFCLPLHPVCLLFPAPYLLPTPPTPFPAPPLPSLSSPLLPSCLASSLVKVNPPGLPPSLPPPSPPSLFPIPLHLIRNRT